MTDWLDNVALGHMIEFALCMIAAEAVALGLYYARSKRGISWADALPNLASGALLMCACRAALGGATATVPFWLAASLVAHGLDLRRRWCR